MHCTVFSPGLHNPEARAQAATVRIFPGELVLLNFMLLSGLQLKRSPAVEGSQAVMINELLLTSAFIQSQRSEPLCHDPAC